MLHESSCPSFEVPSRVIFKSALALNSKPPVSSPEACQLFGLQIRHAEYVNLTPGREAASQLEGPERIQREGACSRLSSIHGVLQSGLDMLSGRRILAVANHFVRLRKQSQR